MVNVAHNAYFTSSGLSNHVGPALLILFKSSSRLPTLHFLFRRELYSIAISSCLASRSPGLLQSCPCRNSF